MYTYLLLLFKELIRKDVISTLSQGVTAAFASICLKAVLRSS
jgi:hypothetical protein